MLYLKMIVTLVTYIEAYDNSREKLQKLQSYRKMPKNVIPEGASEKRQLHKTRLKGEMYSVYPQLPWYMYKFDDDHNNTFLYFVRTA